MSLNAKKLSIVFFFLALVPPSLGQTEERFEFYQGVRQAGMGGAGVAVVNDETALLTNPASLGKLRDHFVTLFDPELTMSAGASDLLTRSRIIGLVEPGGLLSALNNNPSKNFYSKAQIFPSIVFPNFGFGVLVKYEMAGALSEDASLFDYHYINDYAFVLGYNLRFWDGRLKIGMSTRLTNRVVFHGELPADDTEINLKDIASQGMGAGVDAGIHLTMPVVLLPTLSAVVHDVGHTRYNVSNGFLQGDAGEPELSRQSIDVGLALFPIWANHVRGSFTLEYRGVDSTADEEDHMRRAHVGMEVNLADTVFVRAGMHQRYWTAGFEYTTALLQFQGASYGEEIGTADQPREDRRFVLKCSIRF